MDVEIQLKARQDKESSCFQCKKFRIVSSSKGIRTNHCLETLLASFFQ